MAVRGPYESDSSSEAPRTLGARMKMLRIMRGLTQAEMSQALNTDQTVISLWERNKVRPSGAALAGVASFFGVDVQALETGEGLPNPAPAAPRELDPRAAEIRTSLALPDAGSGAVLTMDLQRQTEQRVEPMEAMGFLMKALKAGRSIWIVAE